MGNNVWRNFAYNREQQAGCHWDGLGGNLSYALFEECPSWGTANNNGTLKSNAVGAGGPMLLTSLPTMTATYGYDNLNRLTSASDSGGWARNWGYDRYGNMWMTNATGVPGSPLTPSSSGYFTSANRISGQSYDAAGNQTNYSTYTLTYNATNELTKVADATSGGSVQYTYDAAGHRVTKQFSDGAQRVFVYDALGQLAAEYSNAAQAPTPPCATCYLSTDYLGSVRMITDETGVAVARHDYLPFGEEVPGNMAGRSMLFGQDASVNQKFTGQERDAESNLDFFEARFMSSLQGRFLSPDPFSAGADVGDPQSWNAYSYALNTPLTGTDPTGRSFVPCKSPDSIACVGNDPTPSDNHDGGSAGWINCWWCFLGIGGYGNQSQQPHIPPPPPVPTRIFDWLSQPRNPTCLAASTAAGASMGAAVGMLGLAGGPAVIATEPSAVGIGGGTGWLAGMVMCNSSTGGSGGISGGNTIHGDERLNERKFSPEDIAATKTGEVKTQADGARVYIKDVGNGRFNVIVEGDRGVITALKNISQKALDRLAVNYGWH